jgi:hypothetical protein
VALAAVVALGACTQGGRDDYVRDGDTGAAAPATRPTLDAPSGPDSTAGVSARTGQRGVAGDTTGSTGQATGATNPTASGKAPPQTGSAAGGGPPIKP